MNTHTLIVAVKAVGLESLIYNTDVVEVTLTRSNIEKLIHVAEAVKYAGEHLIVKVMDYADGERYLRAWTEANTADVADKVYTLLVVGHDLESLL